MEKADLSKTSLVGSIIEADLSDAILINANFCEARYPYINLCRANLSGAKLSNVWNGIANLHNANLSEAVLNDANLSRADLSGADLSGAKYNKGTKWPDGFDPIATGAILTP